MTDKVYALRRLMRFSVHYYNFDNSLTAYIIYILMLTNIENVFNFSSTKNVMLKIASIGIV